MPQPNHCDHAQLQSVLTLLQSLLGTQLLAVSVHGSWVAGGLQRHSDIDVLAVTQQSLDQPQRRALTDALLKLSEKYPAPTPGPRCLELVVCAAPTLDHHSWPTTVDYLYGEWLRGEFEAGALPLPHRDPEYCLLLAQAREQSQSLYGPALAQLIAPIPAHHQQRALRELIPALDAALLDDTRNVLLTLARMAYTARHRGFIAKDAAARWAATTLTPAHAALLEQARREYLGELEDDWRGQAQAVTNLAAALVEQVLAAG
ncbi:aminoglycoside adenylyltransferase domain-containing protein [Isoalcanivorax beigongshangi]|uniref:Aminoglycoside (3'') (9) adenylyltransferase n=1 Tax=Isoalcanivorax beigongshangi TaxID=3238810 RepID=A0ABV4AEW8_9GAMM